MLSLFSFRGLNPPVSESQIVRRKRLDWNFGVIYSSSKVDELFLLEKFFHVVEIVQKVYYRSIELKTIFRRTLVLEHCNIIRQSKFQLRFWTLWAINSWIRAKMSGVDILLFGGALLDSLFLLFLTVYYVSFHKYQFDVLLFFIHSPNFLSQPTNIACRLLSYVVNKWMWYFCSRWCCLFFP